MGKELELRINWDVGNSFKMEIKEEGGNWETIANVTDLSHANYADLRSCCSFIFGMHLDEIIRELQA